MHRIYLDNQSGTRLDARVLQSMLPYFDQQYGNAQSMHSLGQQAKDSMEKARVQAADLIGAQNEEVYFTSTASEANNLAIKGIAQAYQSKGRHIILSAIEHFSVLNCGKRLGQAGFEITYLPVDKDGLIFPEDLRKALRPDTILVSIQLANSEIGTVQPVSELSGIAREKRIIFHTDAVYAAGFIDIDVTRLGVDAMTISGNQFYGPKGAAALYLRKGVRITPQIDGGVQEGGRRAGMENIPAIVGFGTACELAKKEMPQYLPEILRLRDRVIRELPEKIEHVYLNGHPQKRTPHNANFSIEFIEGESMMLFLDQEGIYVSSGSACASRALKLSHVLTAIGVDPAVGQGSLSLTLSRLNTDHCINSLIEKLTPIVARLRQMSPLYTHFQKTGRRMAAGPGADYKHQHEHEMHEHP